MNWLQNEHLSIALDLSEGCKSRFKDLLSRLHHLDVVHEGNFTQDLTMASDKGTGVRTSQLENELSESGFAECVGDLRDGSEIREDCRKSDTGCACEEIADEHGVSGRGVEIEDRRWKQVSWRSVKTSIRQGGLT